MFYTYILRSLKQPGAIYKGYTTDLKSRLADHNNPKKSTYSKKYSPWTIESYFAFSAEKQAKNFERYLKASSGKAFMHKRLISDQFKKALVEFNNGRKDQLRKA